MERRRKGLVDSISIALMGDFHVYLRGEQITKNICKSRKGTALIQYLMLHREKPVPHAQLFEALWPQEASSNPENALKTLVSRMRAILNAAHEGLGESIASVRGGYKWRMLPGMSVDYYEVFDLIKRRLSSDQLDAAARADYAALSRLYKGDLLQGENAQYEWAASRAAMMHGQYLRAVYHHIELLKRAGDYGEAANAARLALDIDAFDERLHLELLHAFTKTDRESEAFGQYRHITNLYHRYLGAPPPDAIQAFYAQIMKARDDLASSLTTIKAELEASDRAHGAFLCEYVVFKELYKLQVRNLERLGVPMYLGLIAIGSADGTPLSALAEGEIMRGLLEILRDNLRKGDAITQYLPAQCALLLPTADHESGNMVIERIKRIFYAKFPNSNLSFQYRLTPLGA
jgi:DNA-binding SARP family transcriptional activator